MTKVIGAVIQTDFREEVGDVEVGADGDDDEDVLGGMDYGDGLHSSSKKAERIVAAYSKFVRPSNRSVYMRAARIISVYVHIQAAGDKSDATSLCPRALLMRPTLRAACSTLADATAAGNRELTSAGSHQAGRHGTNGGHLSWMERYVGRR